MIEKKPFVSYTLDEDKIEKTTEVISLKINQSEREMLDELKRCFNTDMDGKIIKQALRYFKKVVFAGFTAQEMMYWTSSDRRKPLFDDSQEKQENAKK